MEHLTETVINEYLDQVLDAASRQQVADHLAVCASCCTRLEGLETLTASLAEIPDLPITRDLAPGVLAGLPDLPRLIPLWQQPGFILQSMLALVLLALGIPRLPAYVQRVWTWGRGLELPQLQLPSLPELVRMIWQALSLGSLSLGSLSLRSQFRLERFVWSFRLPDLPAHLDTNLLVVLVVAAGMLWALGNISLLRTGTETGK